jgi:hypothetical protein
MIGARWKLAALCALALLLAGCASAPRVSVAQDPDAEFERYATFSFAHPLGTDRDPDVSTVLSNLLRSLAMTELEKRGYVHVERGGDLEVDFMVETREKIESFPDPAWGAHYGYWNHPYGVWAGYDHDHIRQYTVGTLHLDLIDVVRKQLIWEAIAEHRIESDFTYEQDDVRTAMGEMFRELPARRAPGR